MVARLSRRFGDFDLAEEAVQSAVAEALDRLAARRPAGQPGRLAAGGRASATPLDAVRRSSRQRALADARAARSPASDRGPAPTTGWRCCSPAATRRWRRRPGWRSRCGPWSVSRRPQIARAFLVNESTLAQRIVRAKRKIVDAGISLAVPPADQLSERLGDVLAVVYVMFNEGFVSSTGATQDRDLAADAVVAGRRDRDRRTRTRPRPGGWPRCSTIQHAPGRRPLRRRTAGWCCSAHQDRSRWDHAAIAEGEAMIERAAALRRPGPLPAPGRDRGRARHRAVVGGDRLAADRDAVRRPRRPRPARPSSGSTRRSRCAQLGAPRARAGPARRAGATGSRRTTCFHAARAELLTALGRHDEADAADRHRARRSPPTTPSAGCSTDPAAPASASEPTGPEVDAEVARRGSGRRRAAP